MQRKLRIPATLAETARQLKVTTHPSLISIDPGETTGYSVWLENSFLPALSGQKDTTEIAEAGFLADLTKLIDKYKPKFLILEEYRIYPHKTKVHTHSDLHTPRLIGAIELIASSASNSVKVLKQGAHLAKGFVSDKKLKHWNLYEPGHPHRNDAVRHAIYAILFNRQLKSIRPV